MCVQEDPTGQKYGRLEEEGGMGPDKVNQQPLAPLTALLILILKP